jgi:hypothetical protein
MIRFFEFYLIAPRDAIRAGSEYIFVLTVPTMIIIIVSFSALAIYLYDRWITKHYNRFSAKKAEVEQISTQINNKIDAMDEIVESHETSIKQHTKTINERQAEAKRTKAELEKLQQNLALTREANEAEKLKQKSISNALKETAKAQSIPKVKKRNLSAAEEAGF